MLNRVLTLSALALTASIALSCGVALAGDTPINPVTGRPDNRYEYRNNGPMQQPAQQEAIVVPAAMESPAQNSFPRVNPLTGRPDNRYEYRMQQSAR
jgi:hypothetical protein